MHYLGDDAYQRMTMPPRPIIVTDAYENREPDAGPQTTLPPTAETSSARIHLGCTLPPSRSGSPYTTQSSDDEEDDGGEVPVPFDDNDNPLFTPFKRAGPGNIFGE